LELEIFIHHQCNAGNDQQEGKSEQYVFLRNTKLN